MRKNFKFFLLFFIIIIFTISFLSGIVYSQDFDGQLHAYFIDVGQGDCILIKTIEDNNRSKMLIDAGQRWKSDDVQKILNYLEIEKIDIVVGTHAHSDHIGGLIDIIDNYKIGKVLDSGVKHDTATYDDYINSINSNDVPLIEVRAGMKKELVEGVNFEILNPFEPLTTDLHKENIVGQLRYEDVGFMLTGDIEKNGEENILNEFENIKNNILKVAHHGSKTSTSKKFLNKVNPDIAIIQVGEDNQYGHPDSEVVNKLKEKNINIYRNDKDGDILVKTDGESYIVKPFEKQEELININTANSEELQELHGVGEVTAQNIIEYRNDNDGFSKIEEIKNVDGIGEVTFDNIKDDITI